MEIKYFYLVRRLLPLLNLYIHFILFFYFLLCIAFEHIHKTRTYRHSRETLHYTLYTAKTQTQISHPDTHTRPDTRYYWYRKFFLLNKIEKTLDVLLSCLLQFIFIILFFGLSVLQNLRIGQIKKMSC